LVVILRRVEALNIKSGPTESGLPAPPPKPVGGDVFLSDKLSLIFSTYWPIIALALIFLSYLLYSRKHKIIKFLWRFK